VEIGGTWPAQKTLRVSADKEGGQSKKFVCGKMKENLVHERKIEKEHQEKLGEENVEART
jgi:hypothetical protein